LLFDYSIGNGIKDGSDYYRANNTSFGGFVFFDASYVEVDVGFAYGSVKSVTKFGDEKKSENGGSLMQLNLALLGKYPIEVSSFTIFPLLGVSYNLVLSAKDEDGNTPKNKDGDDDSMQFSQFGILGGIGADFNLTDALYLRAEALFQVRLASKAGKDMEDGPGDGKAAIGLGPVVKVALGYKF